MIKLKEDNLSQFCYQASIDEWLTNSEVDQFYDQLKEDEILAVNKALGEFLLELKKDNVEVEVEAIPFTQGEDYKSIIFRKRDGEQVNQIGVFSIKNFLLESWLSLIGLALTLSDPPKMVIPAAQAAKSLWDNFKRFKRPEDEDAIDIIETLLKIKAQMKGQKKPGNPSSQEIQENLIRLSSSQFEEAIKKLVESHTIEVAKWGDQKPNLKHPGNHWKIKL